jgi:thioesterase domain-containing protein
MGWKPYALKGVNIHKIPGEHNTIFKAPNDKKFAQELQRCLEVVENQKEVTLTNAKAEKANEIVLA